MLTIDGAFRKFKSRLELNEKEQQNAAARHKEVRDYIETEYGVARSFLTGSYSRHTKTKPLKDIDIFFVLDESEQRYLQQPASVVLDAFHTSLVKEYGQSAVRKQARSINVDFGIVADVDDNTDYRVLSVDAVPAFDVSPYYTIPDGPSGRWIKTNPDTHYDLAVAAHQGYSDEWKGLVRMVKYWNNNAKHGSEKPVKPSFLIEVMALECLHGGWGGSYEREMQAFFATLADRILDEWPDPAGLGPPISSDMDASRKARAQVLLRTAARDATAAIDLSRRGRNGDALRGWRELFGPKFPLS